MGIRRGLNNLSLISAPKTPLSAQSPSISTTYGFRVGKTYSPNSYWLNSRSVIVVVRDVPRKIDFCIMGTNMYKCNHNSRFIRPQNQENSCCMFLSFFSSFRRPLAGHIFFTVGTDCWSALISFFVLSESTTELSCFLSFLFCL